MKYLVSYFDVYALNTVIDIITQQELDRLLASPNVYEGLKYREATVQDLNKLK